MGLGFTAALIPKLCVKRMGLCNVIRSRSGLGMWLWGGLPMEEGIRLCPHLDQTVRS